MKHFLEEVRCRILVVLLCCIVLCGFTKIIDWGKQNFQQAQTHGASFILAAQPYIKNVRIYNQLTVVATFDVMLLTDAMRMLYVDYYVKDHGMSRDQEAMMRQRQINENRYFISMYVIGYQKEHTYIDNKSLFTGEYQKSTEMLKGNDAMWNMRMIVGGRQYLPESVRVVDLPVEYRYCFGQAYNQFATVYLVRFSAVDGNQNYIFSPQKPVTITVRFSSPLYHADITWKNMLYYMR